MLLEREDALPVALHAYDGPAVLPGFVEEFLGEFADLGCASAIFASPPSLSSGRDQRVLTLDLPRGCELAVERLDERIVRRR
jgi:hypothetical protein